MNIGLLVFLIIAAIGTTIGFFYVYNNSGSPTFGKLLMFVLAAASIITLIEYLINNL